MDVRDERVAVDLTADERRLLSWGVLMWTGGPVRCSEELAQAMGFTDYEDLDDETSRLLDEFTSGRPLTRLDWSRALMATGIVLTDRSHGAAWDWKIITGIDDVDAFRMLRGLQSKLVSKGAIVYLGTRPAARPWITLFGPGPEDETRTEFEAWRTSSAEGFQTADRDLRVELLDTSEGELLIVMRRGDAEK